VELDTEPGSERDAISPANFAQSLAVPRLFRRTTREIDFNTSSAKTLITKIINNEAKRTHASSGLRGSTTQP